MEFEGRITRVLPARTGTRQDGTTWVDLSFVFAYYENGEQRFEDSVLVNTFDTNIIRSISQFLAKTKDAEGKEKVVYENDCAKMLVPHIPCRCGFSLRAKTVKKKDESGFIVIQENRCYKLEILGSQQPAPQSQQQPGNVLGGPQTPPYNQQMPFPPQVDNFGYPIQPSNPEDDDLPF
jgi:hypothetical protein